MIQSTLQRFAFPLGPSAERKHYFSLPIPRVCTRGYSSNAPPGLCAVRTTLHSLITIHFAKGTLAFNSSNQFTTTLIWQAPEGRKTIAPGACPERSRGANPGNACQSPNSSALP